jgi:cysteinyl-tRNA synthetase
MLRIRDTMRRDTVELVPREPGKLSMYVCGPTVYDEPHIGHGRYVVVFDVVRRYLEWSGYDVTFVSNVTDVDDNIIGRAAARGTTEPVLAEEYERAWFEQMDRLGVRRPDVVPHATGYIEQMQALIGQLVDAGIAYAIDGHGVYFAVEQFPGYGALPHRSLDELKESAGARVAVDEEKRSPLDFALWKAAKPGEPAWESPWGQGRPGWHIECSAMSLDLLGDGFDLHAGGEDLVFPHHENERVQAEACGHPFARHWMHSGWVMVEGEKMSKSLGNFMTLESALDAHGPGAFRMAVLQTQYRRRMDLGATELEAAAKAVDRLTALVRRAEAAGIDPHAAPLDDQTVDRFRAAMDDDFDSPRAVAVLFDAAGQANRAIDDGDTARAAALVRTVVELTDVVGLPLAEAGGTGDDAAEIDELVRRRDQARADRDFATADAIRDQLTARGVQLEDTPGGTIWHR